MTPVWEVKKDLLCPTDVWIWKWKRSNSYMIQSMQTARIRMQQWVKMGLKGLGGDGRVQSCPFHSNRTANLGHNKRHGCYGNWFLTTKRWCWVLPRLKRKGDCGGRCLGFICSDYKSWMNKRYPCLGVIEPSNPWKYQGGEHSIHLGRQWKGTS